MMLTVLHYTKTNEETFENVFTAENMLMNHVVIPPGKFFPKHPTDAQVTIVILRGELSVSIGDDARASYSTGCVLRIAKGSPSELGNAGPEPTELLVTKTELTA